MCARSLLCRNWGWRKHGRAAPDGTIAVAFAEPKLVVEPGGAAGLPAALAGKLDA
jgi:hypothetical protein